MVANKNGVQKSLADFLSQIEQTSLLTFSNGYKTEKFYVTVLLNAQLSQTLPVKPNINSLPESAQSSNLNHMTKHHHQLYWTSKGHQHHKTSRCGVANAATLLNIVINAQHIVLYSYMISNTLQEVNLCELI